MNRRFGALLAALCLLAGRTSAQDPSPSIRTIARVIATGAVDGRFARPVCDQTDTLLPAETSAFTYALLRSAREPDQPMVIDTGGLLAPHGVAHYSAEHRPAALAQMVRDLGYRALTLGLNDLAAPREPMIEVIRELRALRVPMLASEAEVLQDAVSTAVGCVCAVAAPHGVASSFPGVPCLRDGGCRRTWASCGCQTNRERG